MIKAIAETKDKRRKVLIIGLERANWRELAKGRPIHFNADVMGLPGLDVLIIGGNTHEDLVAQLGPGIGPETVVHDDGKQERH